MYNLLRNYGITASFVIHWVLYYFALTNNAYDLGFNGKLCYSIQWGSLPLLGIGVGVTFYKCIDDCNIKMLLACIFSMTLRFIIIIFKPWGFESSNNIMFICLAAFAFYFPAEYLYNKSKRRKLYL